LWLHTRLPDGTRRARRARQAFASTHSARRGAVEPAELRERLGVSRPTVHRITRDLEERGLVERADGELALTARGETVADALAAFEETVETARRLGPVCDVLRNHGPEVDLEAFAGARVTTAGPGNPYRGVERFMTLVRETDSLRGLDPTAINPLHLDEIHGRILDGMATDAIFSPAVVEELLTSNPERARTAFESGNLVLRTHEDLPFGITLCDDRIGIGVYDDDTGVLGTYVDTDASAAREWTEAVYERYRDEATRLDEHAEFSEFAPAETLVDAGG
jgi:predicted transcriptional regulator